MSARVLVCGGRDFADRRDLFATLDDLTEVDSFAVIIHGGARGADSLAGEWADLRGVQADCYPADWKKHGRAAGPLRNQLMLDEGKPDVVVAFAGGRGTADMIARAKKAGIPVLRFAQSTKAAP